MQINFETLKTPLDGEGGCGPDLEYDAQVGTLLAELDGILPTQSEDFYRFRSNPPDLDKKLGDIVGALGRTRDLRLMVPLARICALQGDMQNFERAVGLVRHYVETAWDGVHPRSPDGDTTLRSIEIERLDEFASVVLPLQYARLVADKAGHVSYRDLAIAAKEVTPRDKETFASEAEIDRLFKMAKIETLLGVRDMVAATTAHLGRIQNELASTDYPVAFDRLSPLLGKMRARVGEALSLRSSELPAEPPPPLEEGEAEGEADAASGGAMTIAVPMASGRVKSHADAEAALAAAVGYFETREPSSPALLLVRQAKALIGLSFPQLLATLAPALLPASKVELGGGSPFVLSIEAMGTTFPPQNKPDASGGTQFTAASRVEAAGLLQEVTVWYRAAEPSNPVPMLLDRARGMMAKDFSALLAELAKKA